MRYGMLQACSLGSPYYARDTYGSCKRARASAAHRASGLLVRVALTPEHVLERIEVLGHGI